MEILLFLMLFPLGVALLLQIFRSGTMRNVLVRVASLVIAAASIVMAVQYLKHPTTVKLEAEWLSYLLMGLEVLMSAFIVYIGFKKKKPMASLLALVTAPLMIWFELAHGHGIEVKADIVIDQFALIMTLIIGVVGSLIVLYTIPYMQEYHHHHKEYKDRTTFFMTAMFVFLSAMFGIVFFNNLTHMFFFWEVTTLCSFLMIGYTGTKEAVNNSFRALIMNLLGGLGFAIGIVVMGLDLKTVELSELVNLGRNGTVVLIPAVLLAFAGLAKAAQMPFSSWLLGAMVAPTPSSALLHSSTMVKAGVFLLLRLAPVFGFNIAGIMVMVVGGITFLLASLIAITMSDGKKLLAWSTVANLGLIVMCAGVGTHEAAWAGVLLIIFHAVAKSLMFLSVGTVEHNIGSRDIEDMHGLITKLPEMAIIMSIGIAGMFLAPFGMLISKWAAMKAFIDSRNAFIVLALVFGSSATLFYWVKWLGKLLAVLGRSERLKSKITKDEYVSLGIHALLTVCLCFLFPLIANNMIEPWLITAYGASIAPILSAGNLGIMSVMLGLILLMPIALYFTGFSKKDKIVTAYMAGVNRGDNRTFTDSFGKDKEMYLTNWYLESFFGEKRLMLIGVLASAATLAVIFLMAVGGVL